MALVFDLQEQPRVLDGQGRLGGEGAEEPHDLRLELSGSLARDGQDADHLILTQQGHTEERAMARFNEWTPDGALVGALYRDVADLNGLPSLHDPAGYSLTPGDDGDATG